MNTKVLVKISKVEENIKLLEKNEFVKNSVCDHFTMDGGGCTKLLIINLISSNDYNCYCVSGDCSCLYKGYSDNLTFSDEDKCINYLDNEVNEIDEDTLEVTMNLSNDETGCDYEEEVYEYVANIIAQYHKKYY